MGGPGHNGALSSSTVLVLVRSLYYLYSSFLVVAVAAWTVKTSRSKFLVLVLVLVSRYDAP